MRKILFTLASIIMVASVSFADNALYIYRNDGRFNAFLDSDIDSMAYSTIDTAGVDHQCHVTQLIYTPDSLYQIPLSAIDSIAFTERPVIYNPQVVKITDEYLPYIISADSLKIQFSSSLPSKLHPYKGDILLYEGFSETFPNGFVGRITDITETSTDMVVECEEVYIDEVYESLTFVSDYVLESAPDEISQYSLRQISPKAKGEASLALNLGLKLTGEDVGSFSASYKGSLRVRAIINMSLTAPFYADLSCTSTHTFAGEFKVETKKKFSWNGDKKIKVFKKTLPLPNCPVLKFDYEVAPFVRGELNGSISATFASASSTTNGVIFRGLSAKTYKRNNGNFSDPQLNTAFNINGTLFGGAICSAYFGSVGNFLGIETNLYVGPKLTGNQSVDLVSLATESVYDAIKDAQIKVSLGAELEAKAKLKLLKWELDKVFVKTSFDYGLWKWYLYPLFSIPTYTHGDNKSIAIIKTTPSRDLLMPVQIGLKQIDEQGYSTTQYTSSTTYRNSTSGGGEYSERFERMKPELNYTFYPMFKIFGMEIQANPSEQVQIEVEVLTGEASDITDSEVVVSGYGDCLETAESICDLGVVYSASGTPDKNNGSFVSSGLSESGEFSITLDNLEPGTTYYYRTCLNLDGKYYYGDVSTFKTTAEETSPYKEVDLGLSVKWAECNVGASSPEGYGGYYAWGETEEKNDYDDDTYEHWIDKDGDGYYESGEFDTLGGNISGTQYDVARKKCGGEWRMPTSEEFTELKNKCTWEWTTYNGVDGCKVTGPNGNSIFLPAAGNICYTSQYYQGLYGYYWSGTLAPEKYTDQATTFIFGSSSQKNMTSRQSFGLTVRPVRDKE